MSLQGERPLSSVLCRIFQKKLEIQAILKAFFSCPHNVNLIRTDPGTFDASFFPSFVTPGTMATSPPFVAQTATAIFSTVLISQSNRLSRFYFLLREYDQIASEL